MRGLDSKQNQCSVYCVFCRIPFTGHNDLVSEMQQISDDTARNKISQKNKFVT